MNAVQFTPSQLRVLPLVREGMRYKTIAAQLGLAQGTVINLVHAMAKRIGCPDDVPPYRCVQKHALESVTAE